MLQKPTAFLRFSFNYWRYRQPRFLTRVQLEQWQDRQVRKHLRFVLKHSGYYRNLFTDLNLGEWRTLPITDKKSMMENFDSFNTIGIALDEAIAVATTAERTRDFSPTIRGATIGLSTGTSGSRSLFLSTPKENSEFVGAAVAKLARRSLIKRQRIAFFHRAHSNLYRDLSTGRLQHQFFDLSESLESQFGRLNHFEPTMVIGPPAVLHRLGIAKAEGRLRIKPSGLLSVAEVLDSEKRSRIESDFQVRVDQAYIATEGFIAATCHLGSLHLNEDMMVVQRQWVDRESRRFIPIITDFRRRTQPIVRYRVDDILVESASDCDCGLPFAVIEQIEGRCDDVLILRSADGASVCRVFPDFVRQAVCFVDQRIKDYQILQDTIDRLNIQIDIDACHQKTGSEKVRSSLIALFRRLGCAIPTITFEPYVEPDPRKKLRRVSRNFPSDWT